ncbi:MAG: hypothetical protein F6K15_34525 [Okeania sp. SIO2B3]|nr:hypothetical protein [Okeania sp. SIO2B3]
MKNYQSKSFTRTSFLSRLTLTAMTTTIIALGSLTMLRLKPVEAASIVPYEKHSSRIAGAWVWRIPVIYLAWDWEKSFKVIPWPTTAPTPPNNPMALLTGSDGMGSSTTFDFFEDNVNNNEIVLEDNGVTQIYRVESGQITYETGALDEFGNAIIQVTDFSLTGSLASADTFSLGNIVSINFVETIDSGSIALGLLDGSPVTSTDTSGLITNLLLQFPNALLSEDQNGYIGPVDLGGTFSYDPALVCHADGGNIVGPCSIPETTPVLGLLALGTLGAGSTLLRKNKQHKSVSKITSDTE